MSDVVWTGLKELQEALRKLPDELTAEAQRIVVAHAHAAEQKISSGYPERSGNLRHGLRTEVPSAGRFGAAARVVNKSPHSGIFESGTQARHDSLGANRGAMPPGHVFVPIVMRERRAMYDDLKRLLESKGMTVTGND